jgi:hypothetical protein
MISMGKYCLIAVFFSEEELRSRQVPGRKLHHVVFVDGPFPAGQFNDIAAFRSRLKDKIKKGKKVIVNGGFPANPQSTTKLEMLVLPRQGYSSKDFANFKSRTRSRQPGAVQQPAQILRLPGWIVPARGRQAPVCL